MRGLTYLLAIVVMLNASAYCDKGITASGEYVRDGICAVDRINGVLVPFGSKVILPNGKVLIVKDRFGANHDNHLDIWMPTEDECLQFGRRNLVCEVIIP
jgi:3D (Asp-Asp-Asp) domain-containing protein